MLAHTVLIITSGLAHRAAPDALDRALKQLVWMKKSPLLVLGADGDDVLRTCAEIEKAEIIFDPNGVTEFSAIKAGLHATEAPAFLWRMDRPFPEAEVWRKLESALRVDKFAKTPLLKLEGDETGLLLTTSLGTKLLKSRPSDAAWPQAPDLTIETVHLSDLPG